MRYLILGFFNLFGYFTFDFYRSFHVYEIPYQLSQYEHSNNYVYGLVRLDGPAYIKYEN